MRQRILKQLLYKGDQSIPEISRKISKTVPTTTNLVEELLAEGFILETGTGESSGGRRPALYAINKDARYILTINVKKRSIEIGALNMGMEPVGPFELFSFDLSGNGKKTDVLIKSISTYLKNNKTVLSKLLGVGICMPGLIDKEKHSNESYFANEGDLLISTIQDMVSVPLVVENDTRVMALGEYRFGKAKGKTDFICLNYDLGIGAGYVFNGKLYYGKSGFAGEFGHIQSHPQGSLCYCGKRGCLETVASGQTLVKKCTEALQGNTVSQLKEIYKKNGKIDLQDFVNAVNNGDEFAIGLLTSAADELGRGLSTLVHLLNPEMIIINGSLAQTGKFLLGPLQHAISKYSLANIHDDVELNISNLGNMAIPYGLAASVVDHYL